MVPFWGEVNMSKFKVGDEVQASWGEFGVVEGRRGSDYVVRLVGSVDDVRTINERDLRLRKGLSTTESRVKALRQKYKAVKPCPCGDPNCPHPGDCDAMSHDEDD